MKKCPFCSEEIQDDAVVCRFCNSDLRSFNQAISGINITNSMAEREIKLSAVSGEYAYECPICGAINSDLSDLGCRRCFTSTPDSKLIHNPFHSLFDKVAGEITLEGIDQTLFDRAKETLRVSELHNRTDRFLRSYRSPEEMVEQKKRDSVFWAKTVVGVLLFTVVFSFLMPTCFPNITNESPGFIILAGIVNIVLGSIVLALDISGTFRFKGSLFFYLLAILGLPLFFYGLISLIF